MHLLPAHDGKTELAAAFLKRQARSLYWRGWPLVDIQEELEFRRVLFRSLEEPRQVG